MPRPLPSPLALAALGALVAASLVGCARAVSVEVAPDAANPVCASVVLALPTELGGSALLTTTSQATAAWGDPAAPIVLRCGVVPPGPTTQRCVQATDASGASVDWIAVEGEPGATGGALWTFTTYGRDPAVEVRVPAALTTDHSTSFLVDLTRAVTKSPSHRACT